MYFKALSPVAASALVLGFACSSPPPEPAPPPAGQAGSGGASAGSSNPTAGSTGEPTAGSGGEGTAGTPSTAGAGGTPGGAGDTAGGNGGTGGGAGGAPDVPDRPGFTIALVENFDAPLDLSTHPVWTYSDGALGEGRVRFAKEGISFENGIMKITASSMAMPGGMSFAEYGQVGLKPLRSGELRTRYNNYRWGRYEARFKAPQPTATPGAPGNLIATLFAFRTPKNINWREIDIEVTGDGPGALTTNLLYGDGVPAWRPDIAEATSQTLQNFNSNEFHEYAFEWTMTGIKWFVDGNLVREKAAGSGLPIPEKSAKIMMNLWIFDGTGFGGSGLANNVYPMVSEYDWFRFYKWNEEPFYPCADPPACLPDEDKHANSKNNPEEP